MIHELAMQLRRGAVRRLASGVRIARIGKDGGMIVFGKVCRAVAIPGDPRH